MHTRDVTNHLARRWCQGRHLAQCQRKRPFLRDLRMDRAPAVNKIFSTYTRVYALVLYIIMHVCVGQKRFLSVQIFEPHSVQEKTPHEPAVATESFLRRKIDRLALRQGIHFSSRQIYCVKSKWNQIAGIFSCEKNYEKVGMSLLRIVRYIDKPTYWF